MTSLVSNSSTALVDDVRGLAHAQPIFIGDVEELLVEEVSIDGLCGVY
jgi:mycofactocin precursor